MTKGTAGAVLYTLKVLTYIEYRAVSGVFRTIEHPTPYPPSECVLPSPQRRGVNTHRAVRGWGVNILEDARHWIGFLQYNPSTSIPYSPYYCSCLTAQYTYRNLPEAEFMNNFIEVSGHNYKPVTTHFCSKGGGSEGVNSVSTCRGDCE
jgi:hypothetical protein